MFFIVYILQKIYYKNFLLILQLIQRVEKNTKVSLAFNEVPHFFVYLNM